MQLHRVVIPPGLIAPARTYSLARDENGFFLIYTGRAMALNRPPAPALAGVAANALMNRIEKKYDAEITANEAKLRELGPKALEGTKHSRYIPRAALQKIDFKSGALYVRFPCVVVHADKKLKLVFPHHDRGTVQSFFSAFTPGGFAA
jgi:hypothetical protein